MNSTQRLPSRFVIRMDQYVGLSYLRVLVFSLAAAYLIDLTLPPAGATC